MSTYRLIFTHINISKGLWDNYIHTLQKVRNVGVIIHTTVARAIFLLFYDDQDTKSELFKI